MPPNTTVQLGSGLPLKQPSLYDVLKKLQTSMLINLHCVKIGQIQTYNATTFSASIQIMWKRVMADGTTAPYPILVNCPVVTMQGGGASLQFPIAAGDQCLVMFADRNIDSWFQNGGAQAPFDGRLHDISDAVAIVGLNYSASTAIAPISSTEARLILSDGTTKIGLKSGKITIQNATQNLGTVLNSFMSTVASATTVAQIAAAASTAQTALAALLY